VEDAPPLDPRPLSPPEPGAPPVDAPATLATRAPGDEHATTPSSPATPSTAAAARTGLPPGRGQGRRSPGIQGFYQRSEPRPSRCRDARPEDRTAVRDDGRTGARKFEGLLAGTAPRRAWALPWVSFRARRRQLTVRRGDSRSPPSRHPSRRAQRRYDRDPSRGGVINADFGSRRIVIERPLHPEVLERGAPARAPRPTGGCSVRLLLCRLRPKAGRQTGPWGQL